MEQTSDVAFKRLGVLVVSENASVRQGGESYLPIQWFRELLKGGVDVHLLVHARSKPELDHSLSMFASRIHYVPEVRLQTLLWKLGNALPTHIRDFTSTWLVHLVTQFMQRHLAWRLIRQHNIDVLHELTPVAPRLPSMMYGLGVPVVIGPMNGNMTYPPGYRGSLSFAWRAFVPVARGFAGLANRLIPGKRRADVLLVANERTRLALPASYQGKVGMLCENGVDPDVWRRPDDLPVSRADAPRLAFLGRLVDWKGVDLALDVLVQVRKQMPETELHIIGDGPVRPRLQAQAEALGVADAVSFHGWVSPEECPRLLAESDVLLFPSVYDCGGAAVLEAMALGLAVVALNWGGPGDYLAGGAGVLVEPAGRQEKVAGLTAAVLSLTPSRRQELGEAAQRRIADHYTWPAKIEKIMVVYQSVTNPSPATATNELRELDPDNGRGDAIMFQGGDAIETRTELTV